MLWTGEGAGVDIPKETHMHIWRLKALKLGSPHWEASTNQGDVIVRAESEANARHLAAKAFGIRARNGAVESWRIRGIAHGLWRQKSSKGRNSTQMERKKFFIALSHPSAGRDDLPALTSPAHVAGFSLPE